VRAFLATALLVVVAVLPAADAQQPVEQCSRQCDPLAPDVNKPPLRSQGNVNVILYAHYEDILQLAPINTVPPDPRHEGDLRGRFIMPVIVTKTRLGCQVGQCLDVNLQNNLFRSFFSVFIN